MTFLEAMVHVYNGFFVKSDYDYLYFKKDNTLYYTTINDDYCGKVDDFVYGEIDGKWKSVTAKDEKEFSHIMQFLKPDGEVS